jgi:hypothetical protein
MPGMHVVLSALLLASGVARPASAEGRTATLDTSGNTTTPRPTTFSTLTVTPTTTNTKVHSPAWPTASFTDGRCTWSALSATWKCDRKGFVCEGWVDNSRHDHHGVCVDRRTPEQKEADKQEAANGKNGRCAYSYDTQSYYCTHRGSFCTVEMVCADHRTAEEKAEDQAVEAFKEALREEDRSRRSRINAIVGGAFSGLIGVGVLCCIWRCWRRKRQAGAPAREQVRRERQDAMELRVIADKENKRKARLDEELERALIKGIMAGRPGSLEQRDLVAQLERVRVARAAKATPVGVGGGVSGCRDDELPGYTR